jgi:hypothetical protein
MESYCRHSTDSMYLPSCLLRFRNLRQHNCRTHYLILPADFHLERSSRQQCPPHKNCSLLIHQSTTNQEKSQTAHLLPIEQSCHRWWLPCPLHIDFEHTMHRNCEPGNTHILNSLARKSQNQTCSPSIVNILLST